MMLPLGRLVKTRWSFKTAICPALVAAVLGLTAVVVLFSGHSRQEISILPVGATNGVVGITNGRWMIYCVSNHTTNSFSYGGVKIELKTNKGWLLDPALRPTELGGWIAPPSRVWHDGSGILIGGASFHVFFNAPENDTQWRASLRFFRRRPPAVSDALKSDPSVIGAAATAAGDILDYPRSYDVQVPASTKLSPASKNDGN